MGKDKGLDMTYEIPQVIDHGSIADHTFQRCGGQNTSKVGGTSGLRDKECECSHSVGVDQCGT
jgi:hypothetical protein